MGNSTRYLVNKTACGSTGSFLYTVFWAGWFFLAGLYEYYLAAVAQFTPNAFEVLLYDINSIELLLKRRLIVFPKK
jgi:hypothetical protein